MILTKNIKIIIFASNINYYKSKGYIIKIGDEIDIKIEDINKNSKNKIRCKCDNCGLENEISYYAYNKNYKNGNVYYCFKCKELKINKTNNEKYGCDRPIQNKHIMEKKNKTNLEKYGYEVATKNIEVINKIKNKNDELYLSKYKKYNILNKDNSILIIKCDKCNKTYESTTSLFCQRINYNIEPCIYCNPINNFISGEEINLLNFIKEKYKGEIIENSRSIINPYELDIYLPELKLAFEYNGLYWHSELHKEKDYHKIKNDLCDKKGIQLIHIWEDDWLYKKETIKSIILNKIQNKYITIDNYNIEK